MTIPSSVKAPLRVAICGLGDWAWRHVRLLRETGGFELCAVSSRSDAAWQRARAALPGVAVFREQKELLSAAKPDLVIITTPHHLHASMSIEALRAGCHVIVEKPMATALPAARAMLAAAKEAGRMLAVYHNRRFDPWLVAARDVVQQGAIGRIVELNAAWPDNSPAGTWRRRKLESGGLFYDLGAHMVDYLSTLADSRPRRVSGHVHRRAGGDPALNEDHVTAAIQFESGARGRIEVSTLDFAPACRFHLVGEAGTLTDAWNWGGGHGEIRTRAADGSLEVRAYDYGAEDESGGGRPIYRNIAAHLFHGEPLAIPPEAALMNVAVLMAAEASAAKDGAWIDLPQFIAEG